LYDLEQGLRGKFAKQIQQPGSLRGEGGKYSVVLISHGPMIGEYPASVKYLFDLVAILVWHGARGAGIAKEGY